MKRKYSNQVTMFLVEIKNLRRYEVPPLLRRRVGIGGAMAVGGVEADLRRWMGSSGDKSRCGGREGHVSGPDKEDDDADEARGCDA